MSGPATSGPAGAALSAAPGEARVTGTLLKLHALLWWRELKGNAAKIFTLIVLGIYLVLGLVGAVLPMIAAASGVLDPELIPLFTGGGTLAYVLGMWYFGDTDRHLNPGILGTLPLTSRQVAPALAASAGLRIFGLACVICSVVTGLALTITPLATGSAGAGILALAMAPLGLAISLLLGEVLAGVVAIAARVTLLKVLGLIAVLAVAALGVVGLQTGVIRDVGQLGAIVAWTPFGAPGGAVSAAIGGNWPVAAGRALVALVTVALALVALRASAAAELRPRKRPAARAAAAHGQTVASKLLLPGLPSAPFAAVFSRAVRYAPRDNRNAELLAAPVIGLGLLAFYAYLSDGALGVGQVIMVLFFAVFIAGLGFVDDFGMDGPGGWSLLVSGVRGRTALLGRHLFGVITVLASGGIVLAGIAVVSPATLNTTVLLAIFGVAISLLGTSLLLTALLPYPTTAPGAKMLTGGGNSMPAGAWIATFVFMLVGWLPILPGLLVAVLGSGGLHDTGLVLLVALPLVFYVIAATIASWRVERAWPEIFGKVRSWVG